MSNIYLYESNAIDLEGMGLVGALTPTECIFSEEANGLSEIHLTHPLDEWARCSQLAVGRILKAPVPVRSLPEIENGEIVTKVEYWQVKEGAAKDLRWAWSKEKGGCRTGLPKPLQRVTVVKKGNSRYKIKYTKIDGKGKKSSASGWIDKNALEYISEQDIGSDPNAIEEVAPAWSVREQYFRIYEVRASDMNGAGGGTSAGRGVTVSARHIFYDLMGNLTSYKPEGEVNCQTALNGILNGCVSGHDFEAAANIGDSRAVKWERVNPVSAILDPDEGLCAQFGGELVRDNWEMTLLASAGMNRGVRIEYRKNMLGVECQTGMDSVVTRVMPMGQTAKGKPLGMGGDAPWVDSPRIGDYPAPHIYVLDKGSEIKAKSTSGSDVSAARNRLRQAAQDYFTDNPGIDQPEIALSVDFIALGDTAEYAQYRDLESVHLYDKVRVRHAPLNIDVLAQVNRIEFDCLNGRVKGIELGGRLINLARERVPAWQLPGNISGAKLLNGTVEAGQLASGAVNDENMADGAVSSDKLQEGAVVFGKIAADAVDADSIRAGAVTASKIAAEAITSDKIAAGAVNADKIEANSITAEQLQAGLITAGSGLIETGAIGTAQIADGSITDAKIVELTANKITSGTLDASRVTVNNLVADNITTGTLNGRVIPQLGSDKLQNGAVTGDKVAQNAITTDKVVASAITADKLAAASVTANKIAANAIDAGKIAAGAVNADKIASDSIEGRHIRAGAITADKIQIGEPDNLAKDPSFERYDWPAQSHMFVTTEMAHSGSHSLKIGSGAANYESMFLREGEITVRAGDKFYIEYWAYRRDASAHVFVTLGVMGYDGMENPDLPGMMNGGVAWQTQANNTWKKYAYTGTADRDGVARIRANYGLAEAMTGDWFIDDVVVRRISDHLSANAVEISPENGIVVAQSGLKTKFQADAQRFGIYDETGAMLAGAGYDANTRKGYFATKQMRDTSKNSEFYVEFMDLGDPAMVGLMLKRGQHTWGQIIHGLFTWNNPDGSQILPGMQIYADSAMRVAAANQMIYDAPEGHYFTGGSIISENHVRPAGNGTANCGLTNNRWNIVYSKNQLNVSSDARIKQDIAPIKNAKELIMGLRPRQYRLRSEAEGARRLRAEGVCAADASERTAENEPAAGKNAQNSFQQKHLSAQSSRANAEGGNAAAPAERTALHTGFIAQHVLKLAPDWAAADGSDPDNLGMMYDEILAPLVQVVQDQQREIERLKARMEEL